MDYEALVAARITRPLGMGSTSITLSSAQRARLAIGHDDQLAAVPLWDLPTLAGAGALRSTANDLLPFLSACLGFRTSNLTPAPATMLAARRPTGVPSLDVALGWHIISRNGSDLIWHNGGTGGYRTFIGYDPRARVGVVVLSNTSTAAGVDDIGMHLLDATRPLVAPPKARVQDAVDPSVSDRYVGRYQLAPAVELTISRDGDRLFAQATNQPRVELFAEGDGEYFLKAVDAQITFVTGERGPATALVLHQNGANLRASRID